MKSFIRQATETVYSEQFDFESILEKLLTRTDKLPALIAIKFAVNIDEPITRDDIKQALEEVHSAKRDLKEDGEMKASLKFYKNQQK